MEATKFRKAAMVAAFGTGFAVGNALWAGGPAVENPITGVRIANESTSYPFSRTRNLIKWLAIGGFGAYAGCFFLFLAAEEVGRRGFEKWKREIGLGKQMDGPLSGDELLSIARQPGAVRPEVLADFRKRYAGLLANLVTHRSGIPIEAVEERIKVAVTRDVAALVMEKSQCYDPLEDEVNTRLNAETTSHIANILIRQIKNGERALTIPINSIK